MHKVYVRGSINQFYTINLQRLCRHRRNIIKPGSSPGYAHMQGETQCQLTLSRVRPRKLYFFKVMTLDPSNAYYRYSHASKRFVEIYIQYKHELSHQALHVSIDMCEKCLKNHSRPSRILSFALLSSYFCLFDLILYVHSTIFQLCGTVLPGFNQY